MLVLVNRIIRAIEHRLELNALARTRRALLDRSDRFLEDVGISRELLEAGVHAWPWRIDGDAFRSTEEGRSLSSAIRELNAYSDRELADLGLARADIPHAVVHGRPGVDRDAPTMAVTAGRASLRKAIRELNAYSDRELADLGLTRADIPRAVLYGRPGIDRDARSEAA